MVTYLPLLLLALDLGIIAAGAHAIALRLLWHIVGFAVVYLAAWWTLARLASAGRRVVWLALLSAVCLPAAWGAPEHSGRGLPTILNADPDSDLLWSMAFQDPAQRLARYQPVEGDRLDYEVHVRLAAPYHGAARLYAAVNGVDVGPLAWPEDESADQVEATAPVPPRALLCSPAGEPACAGLPAGSAPSLGRRPETGGRLALVVVWQDHLDPQLRIVAQRAYGGATLGPENSWFFDGATWLRGVGHTATGQVAPGLWHVFLSHGHVGR